jgi:hypothetical protein
MQASVLLVGRFVATHANLSFVAVPDLETARTVVPEIKVLARCST